jgi:hypothetical protein
MLHYCHYYYYYYYFHIIDIIIIIFRFIIISFSLSFRAETLATALLKATLRHCCCHGYATPAAAITNPPRLRFR